MCFPGIDRYPFHSSFLMSSYISGWMVNSNLLMGLVSNANLSRKMTFPKCFTSTELMRQGYVFKGFFALLWLYSEHPNACTVLAPFIHSLFCVCVCVWVHILKSTILFSDFSISKVPFLYFDIHLIKTCNLQHLNYCRTQNTVLTGSILLLG